MVATDLNASTRHLSDRLRVARFDATNNHIVALAVRSDDDSPRPSVGAQVTASRFRGGTLLVGRLAVPQLAQAPFEPEHPGADLRRCEAGSRLLLRLFHGTCLHSVGGLLSVASVPELV